MTANKLASTVRWRRFPRLASRPDTVYIIGPGRRHDACTLQSHGPLWRKCCAEMKYRTCIYYLLAAAAWGRTPLTITVYMRHHKLLPQMDASVRVRERARQCWLADESDEGYKIVFLSLALTHCGHLRSIISPVIQGSLSRDMPLHPTVCIPLFSAK